VAMHVHPVWSLMVVWIDQPTEWKMKATSTTLCTLLAAPSDDDVTQLGEWRYYLELTNVKEHRNHFTSEHCAACNSYCVHTLWSFLTDSLEARGVH